MRLPANTRYIFKVETMYGTVIVPSTIGHIYYILHNYFKINDVSILFIDDNGEYSWVNVKLDSLFNSKSYKMVSHLLCAFVLSNKYKKISEKWNYNIRCDILQSSNNIPLTNITNKNNIGRIILYFLFSDIDFSIESEVGLFGTNFKKTFKWMIKFIKNTMLENNDQLPYLIKVNDTEIDIIGLISLYKDYCNNKDIVDNECDLIRINALYPSLLFLNIDTNNIIESDNTIYKQLFGIKIDENVNNIIRIRPKIIYKFEYYIIDNVKSGPVAYNNNCLLRVIDVKR